jgi:Ca-activated chloride channel family protein
VIPQSACDGHPAASRGAAEGFGVWMAALLFVLLKALSAQAASLALVLAVDVSASVTPESYVLQRDGIARAFENATLVQAISALPDGIEVLVLEWSDPDKIEVTVGWTRVADRDSAAAFSTAVRATRRTSSGLTAIGPALLAAAAAFEKLPEPAQQRVIDLSGDGMANFGVSPIIARDRIVAAGISINGLAILTQEPWLEGYYRSNVIGGSGSFVMVAQDFRSFADAVTRKLVMEVAGGASDGTRGRAAETGACPVFAAFLSSCARDGSTALASSPAEKSELSRGPQGGSSDLSTLR